MGMQIRDSWIENFVNLFFPNLCPACSSTLFRQERLICTRCNYHLPRTGFHSWRGNPVEMVFWGRVPVQYATAGFYFQKKGRFQKLIHGMKYNGRKEIGEELGRMMGFELRNTVFMESNIVIPVPLHPSKLRKRGYNQSEAIARGIAEAMVLPLDTQSLIRCTASSTQTRKSRYDRWKNVEQIFALQYPEKIAGKHVLLIDDVITTGATLEACIQEIRKAAEVKVSVATLAVA